MQPRISAGVTGPWEPRGRHQQGPLQNERAGLRAFLRPELMRSFVSPSPWEHSEACVPGRPGCPWRRCARGGRAPVVGPRRGLASVPRSVGHTHLPRVRGHRGMSSASVVSRQIPKPCQETGRNPGDKGGFWGAQRHGALSGWLRAHAAFQNTAGLCEAAQLRFVPLKINLPLTEAVVCFPYCPHGRRPHKCTV